MVNAWKKILATIVASSSVPLLGICGVTTTTVILSVVIFLSGASSIFLLEESDLLLIKIQAIVSPISQIRQRVPDQIDVVVINLKK